MMKLGTIISVVGLGVLFATDSLWAGLLMVLVGVILSIMENYREQENIFKRELGKNAMTYYASQVNNQNPNKEGINWILKDLEGQANPAKSQYNMPSVRNGMFGLPIQVGDVSNFVDFRHNTRIMQ